MANNLVRERRMRRTPYSLFILPLFLLALGTLLYVANNRNIFPSGANPYALPNTITPALSPASGRIQVGVGGGPGTATPSSSVSPTVTPTPTTQAPKY